MFLAWLWAPGGQRVGLSVYTLQDSPRPCGLDVQQGWPGLGGLLGFPCPGEGLQGEPRGPCPSLFSPGCPAEPSRDPGKGESIKQDERPQHEINEERTPDGTHREWNPGST